MKNFSLVFFFIFSLGARASDFLEESVKFRPHQGINATISVNRTGIEYTLTSAVKSKKIFIPLDIESQPHLDVKDFNFDGRKDFSVWYVDEGMGNYTIHRVFVYKPRQGSFEEMLPRCGEEFLNLKINHTKQELTSTYFSKNKPMICLTRLKKTH
jgi:hypothetical protein